MICCVSFSRHAPLPLFVFCGVSYAPVSYHILFLFDITPNHSTGHAHYANAHDSNQVSDHNVARVAL